MERGWKGSGGREEGGGDLLLEVDGEVTPPLLGPRPYCGRSGRAAVVVGRRQLRHTERQYPQRLTACPAPPPPPTHQALAPFPELLRSLEEALVLDKVTVLLLRNPGKTNCDSEKNCNLKKNCN